MGTLDVVVAQAGITALGAELDRRAWTDTVDVNLLGVVNVPSVDPADITHAVLYLASDESRYVTGMQLRVDAGGYLTVREFQP